MLIKDDWTFTDTELGGLIRRGVDSWYDLSKLDLNEIALWEIGNSESTELCFRIFSGLRSRGMNLVNFDAFKLLKSSIRQRLESYSIMSVRGIADYSERELKEMLRFEDSVRNCLNVLAMSDLSPRPECVQPEFWMESLILKISAGVGVEKLSEETGVSVLSMKRKLAQIRNYEQCRADFDKQLIFWKKQVSDFDCKV